MPSGIYRITCRPTGEFYIGKAKHLGRRWAGHLSLLLNGRHHAPRMQSAFRDHGPTAFQFEVLELCPSHALAGLERRIERLRPAFNCAVAGAPLADRPNADAAAPVKQLAAASDLAALGILPPTPAGLTDKQWRANLLYEAGRTQGEIARLLKISRESVNRRIAAARRGIGEAARGDKPGIGHADRAMYHLRMAGKNDSEIAAVFGITRSAVNRRINATRRRIAAARSSLAGH